MISHKDNKGFTLMELLVSMSIFLIIVGISSGIFIQTLRTQRTIISLSESLNNVTLALEQIAREIRTGYDFPAVDSDVGGDDILGFTSDQGESISFWLIDSDGDGQGEIGRCPGPVCGGLPDNYEPITSANVDMQRLRFYIRNDSSGQAPPRVTVVASVVGDRGITVDLQTTVSSRILDTND